MLEAGREGERQRERESRVEREESERELAADLCLLPSSPRRIGASREWGSPSYVVSVVYCRCRHGSSERASRECQEGETRKRGSVCARVAEVFW